MSEAMSAGNRFKKPVLPIKVMASVPEMNLQNYYTTPRAKPIWLWILGLK
jgi:hypothetical protein